MSMKFSDLQVSDPNPGTAQQNAFLHFLTTLPGMLTAVAGIATAITGFVALAHQTDGSASTGGFTPAPNEQVVPAAPRSTDPAPPGQGVPAAPVSTPTYESSTDPPPPPATDAVILSQSTTWSDQASALCANYLAVIGQLNASSGNTVGDQGEQIQALGLDLGQLFDAPALAHTAVGLLATAADRYITAYELLLTDQQPDAIPILQEGFDTFTEALTNLVSAGADGCQ